MGFVKNLMIEMEEAQWEEADAAFHCPVCKKDVDGSVDLPVVYESGEEEELPVSVACFGCNNSFDGWVKTDWDNCEIKLDDYPDILVESSPAQDFAGDDEDDNDQAYFEWLDQQERLSRPVLQSFCKTIEDVKALTSRPPTH